MDRGTKLMFGAMTVAICLMAFNMVGGKSQEANASMNAGHDYRGGTEPTIVWYQIVQMDHGQNETSHAIYRAWSDGTIEWRWKRTTHWNGNCDQYDYQCSNWIVISSPNDGLAALSDLNDDAVVDINDLLIMLGNWGPCP